MDNNAASVVFIDEISSRYKNDYTAKDVGRHSVFSVMKQVFLVPLNELPGRFVMSLVPPLTKRYRYVYSDLLGPVIILAMLAALLHYGHAAKLPSAAASISPVEALVVYVAVVFALSYTLARSAAARITVQELASLLGYGLLGHVLALAASLVFYHETSNTFFFCCVVVFGGLSALRVAFVLLAVIPVPAARLVVCSVVATLQLLSLIFLHFAYMHRTFMYGRKP